MNRVEQTIEPEVVDLSVDFLGLHFENPLLSASGTFGYGLEFGHLTRLGEFGGLVTKGLSLKPLRGNDPQRIVETRGGMLNSIGLQNIGIEAFERDVLPGLEGYPAQVITNLFGYSLDEYVSLAERVDRLPGVAAVELNVSCPNVKRGGIQFGQDPQQLATLVAAVRPATRKPIIVKISPNVTSPVEMGLAAKEAGADALSAINTILGMSIDTQTRRPHLNTIKGGLSGPAIRPIALRMVFDLSRGVDLPLMGIGGIESVDDVLQFLLAGASVVQIGTALFRRPDTVEVLLRGLRARLAEDGVARARDLIGAIELGESE